MSYVGSPGARHGRRPVDSTAHRDTRGGEIEFRTLSDLRTGADKDSRLRWILHGYVARSMITLLVGSPKSGKSTFVFGLLRALQEEAGEFMGLAVQKADVVFLSEEGAPSLIEKAERFCVTQDMVWFLTRREAFPRNSFDGLIGKATQQALAVGATLIVVDTLTFWGNLPPDAEKDAGAIQAVLDGLQEAAAQGIAVLVIHHTRKSGGDDTLAVRGSSALAAGVDIVVELTRHGGEGHGRRRILKGFSRYEQTPVTLTIELRDNTYASLGAPGEQAAQRRDVIFGVLPKKSPGLAQAEIVERTGIPQQRVADVLATLVSAGTAVRLGQGRRGDAFRFHRAQDMDSTAARLSMGGSDECSASSSANRPRSRACRRCGGPALLDRGRIRCGHCGCTSRFTPIHLASEERGSE